MLTREEVLKVIDACTNSRDKAIISLLYDASARPVDLREMRWKDVQFDDDGAMIHTSAKTGKERKIRLTPISLSYLAQWKSDYPGDPTGENYVFVSLREYESAARTHIPVENTAFLRLIRTLRQRTGIQKLKPSIFRPSRITHDVADGYDLQYLMLKNWGSLKSSMIEYTRNPARSIYRNMPLKRQG